MQPQQSHICQVWLWDGVLSGQRRLEIQAGVLSRHSWGIPGEDEVQAGLWGFNGKRAIETAWTSRAGAKCLCALCCVFVFFSSLPFCSRGSGERAVVWMMLENKIHHTPTSAQLGEVTCNTYEARRGKNKTRSRLYDLWGLLSLGPHFLGMKWPGEQRGLLPLQRGPLCPLQLLRPLGRGASRCPFQRLRCDAPRRHGDGSGAIADRGRLADGQPRKRRWWRVSIFCMCVCVFISDVCGFCCFHVFLLPKKHHLVCKALEGANK